VFGHEKTPQTFSKSAAFIALGVEHHMAGNMLETQDFYECSLCSNAISLNGITSVSPFPAKPYYLD
jgi:hypothetical protein